MQRVRLRKEFDPLAFLELFWSEPIIEQPTEGYRCYESIDTSGMTLRLGINSIEESVQIDLKVADKPVAKFSFELVEYIDIIDTDRGLFSFSTSAESSNLEAEVKVELRPQIQVSGATLRIK